MKRLLVQFGPSTNEDIDSKQAKIRQTSTVEKYINRFEQLAYQTHNWSKLQLVKTFLEALGLEI